MGPEVLISDQGNVIIRFGNHSEVLSCDAADKLGFEMQRIARRCRSDKVSDVLRRELGWPSPATHH